MLFCAFFLRKQINPFEIIRNSHLEGTMILFRSPFFVDGSHFRVSHSRLGIGNRSFEALAMFLLRRAPRNIRHVGVFRYDGFPVWVQAEHQAAQPASKAFKRGMKGYLCHSACFLQGSST